MPGSYAVPLALARRIMSMAERVERVVAYVDGFNLYFGLKSSGWQRYYWLNVQRLSSNLLKPGQTLVATKYFTSHVSCPPDKQKRQATFLEALQMLKDLKLFYGKFQPKFRSWLETVKF